MIQWNGLRLGVRIMLIYMMMLETPEEKSLFEQIYLEYRGLMFHVAYEILHNEQDAEDAVHQAFVKIAENIKKIDAPVCPKTHSYVVTIVEHQAIDQYKIAGMGDSVDGLRGEQPQGGQGRGVEAASGTGRRHIGNGQKRPRRVGWRELLDILQQRHLISDGTAHFRNEPIHIGHVLKFRPFLVVAHHAENGSRYDGTFTVCPNLFALRLTNQIVRQVPGQHFCTVGVSLTDGVNDGLEQIVAHTLFGVLEVQHQNLITQLFQKISGVVEQFGFGVGAEDGFSGESQKTDTFQNQTS